MATPVVSDALWERIEPLLPADAAAIAEPVVRGGTSIERLMDSLLQPLASSTPIY